MALRVDAAEDPADADFPTPPGAFMPEPEPASGTVVDLPVLVQSEGDFHSLHARGVEEAATWGRPDGNPLQGDVDK